jgi:hypothetical protein
LKNRNISYTNTLDVVNMLVESIETSEWALQGLPNDELSLQNAAIVTKAQVDIADMGYRVVNKFEYAIASIIYINWLKLSKYPGLWIQCICM